MKNTKKLIAIALSLLTLLVSLCSCGASDNQPEPSAPIILDTNNDQNNQDEQPTESNPTEEPAPVDKYTSELLTPIVFPEDAANFGQMDGGYYIDAKNVLRHVSDVDGTWFSSDKDTAEYFVFNGGDRVGYYDSKGYAHLFFNGDNYIASNVKGTILGGFKDMFGGDCVLFSQDDQGVVYVSSFDKAGYPGTYENDRLYIKDTDSNTLYDRVDRFELVQANALFFLAEVGDKTFYTSLSINVFDNKVQVLASPLDAENLDKVWDCGYMIIPAYSTSDTDTKLYYGNWNNTFTLDLPTGYQVKDLKDVFLHDTTYLIMNDGAVFSTQLTNTVIIPTFEKVEELSNGKITDYYAADGMLFVKMDDGVIYQVGGEDEEESWY